MAARRSSFRFRLPWSQDAPASPATPASQPSTRPSTSTTSSQTTRPAAGSQPAVQATSETNLSTAETPTGNKTSNATKNTTLRTPSSPTQSGTENSNQLPSTSTTPAPSTSNPGPAPASTSMSPTPSTPAVAGSSAETKAPVQPSTNSPGRPMPQTSNPSIPKTSQRPPFRPAGAAPSKNPSPKIRASRNEPQPSSPPQATSKSRITSQPASASGAAAKSGVSQSPSPSRSAPQSPAMAPTSSTTSKASQVLSSKENQESSNSPAVANSQIQEKNHATPWPTLAPKPLQETLEPYSKSTRALPPIPNKEPVELQTKDKTKSDAISETKIKFRDKAMQPSEETVPKSTLSGIKEGPSNKSDSSSIAAEPKMLKESATNEQETKEVKEVVQESGGKNYGAGKKNSEVQSKQAHIVKQGETSKDHILTNPISNGRQTRTSTSQPRNKTMIAGSSQETPASNAPQTPILKEIKDNISKVINIMAVGGGKQETGKTPVNVITLAGDNRGASMQLGSDSSTKGGQMHIHRGYKINPDGSADATTEGERSSKRKKSNDAKTMEDQTIAAYINCNVQSINSSIVFNSSIAERDPGVHMLIPRMPSEHVQTSEETGQYEAHKTEFSVRPAQIIRRRCLRGLFLESSDSDPDNPGKPRRHGCRVSSKEKAKITG